VLSMEGKRVGTLLLSQAHATGESKTGN